FESRHLRKEMKQRRGRHCRAAFSPKNCTLARHEWVNVPVKPHCLCSMRHDDWAVLLAARRPEWYRVLRSAPGWAAPGVGLVMPQPMAPSRAEALQLLHQTQPGCTPPACTPLTPAPQPPFDSSAPGELLASQAAADCTAGAGDEGPDDCRTASHVPPCPGRAPGQQDCESPPPHCTVLAAAAARLGGGVALPLEPPSAAGPPPAPPQQQPLTPSPTHSGPGGATPRHLQQPPTASGAEGSACGQEAGATALILTRGAAGLVPPPPSPCEEQHLELSPLPGAHNNSSSLASPSQRPAPGQPSPLDPLPPPDPAGPCSRPPSPPPPASTSQLPDPLAPSPGADLAPGLPSGWSQRGVAAVTAPGLPGRRGLCLQALAAAAAGDVAAMVQTSRRAQRGWRGSSSGAGSRDGSGSEWPDGGRGASRLGQREALGVEPGSPGSPVAILADGGFGRPSIPGSVVFSRMSSLRIELDSGHDVLMAQSTAPGVRGQQPPLPAGFRPPSSSLLQQQLFADATQQRLQQLQQRLARCQPAPGQGQQAGALQQPGPPPPPVPLAKQLLQQVLEEGGVRCCKGQLARLASASGALAPHSGSGPPARTSLGRLEQQPWPPCPPPSATTLPGLDTATPCSLQGSPQPPALALTQASQRTSVNSPELAPNPNPSPTDPPHPPDPPLPPPPWPSPLPPAHPLPAPPRAPLTQCQRRRHQDTSRACTAVTLMLDAERPPHPLPPPLQGQGHQRASLPACPAFLLPPSATAGSLPTYLHPSWQLGAGGPPHTLSRSHTTGRAVLAALCLPTSPSPPPGRACATELAAGPPVGNHGLGLAEAECTQEVAGGFQGGRGAAGTPGPQPPSWAPPLPEATAELRQHSSLREAGSSGEESDPLSGPVLPALPASATLHPSLGSAGTRVQTLAGAIRSERPELQPGAVEESVRASGGSSSRAARGVSEGSGGQGPTGLAEALAAPDLGLLLSEVKEAAPSRLTLARHPSSQSSSSSSRAPCPYPSLPHAPPTAFLTLSRAPALGPAADTSTRYGTHLSQQASSRHPPVTPAALKDPLASSPSSSAGPSLELTGHRVGGGAGEGGGEEEAGISAALPWPSPGAQPGPDPPTLLQRPAAPPRAALSSGQTKAGPAEAGPRAAVSWDCELPPPPPHSSQLRSWTTGSARGGGRGLPGRPLGEPPTPRLPGLSTSVWGGSGGAAGQQAGRAVGRGVGAGFRVPVRAAGPHRAHSSSLLAD
ncbi:hypothetical protein QJQ45_018418, partial [Haematococcus lacustris]